MFKKLSMATTTAIRTFSAQSPEKMAAFNLAADAVVLWLDPDVAASHYQMPYKFSDAIAMGAPVIASPLSDLAALPDVIWEVPFGDYAALARTLRDIFADNVERERRQAAGRNLFEREFTYRAARANFALACHMLEGPQASYPVAAEFVTVFRSFCERIGAQDAMGKILDDQ